MFHPFHQAHNFSMRDVQINTVGGYQYNHIYDNNQADPIFHLRDLVWNLEATHDTETYALRGCHPTTRESIREYLVGRASDPTRPPLCWLSGPAGTGKTAVALSVAKECQESGTLISSFFFSRNHSRRNNPSFLFLSIAYGLARSIPELREAIGRIIRKDPAVLRRALDIQFQELIVKPCRQLAVTRKWEDLPRLIIIDGLDECQDSKIQKRLLEIITQAFTTYKQFPLRFLICSRPEPAIRETFDSLPKDSIMDHVRLDDAFHDVLQAEPAISEAFNSPRTKYLVDIVGLDDSFQTRQDIETYLLDKLTRIRDEAKERGLYPPHDWPGSVIDHLTEKASGHFSCASSMVRFIDDEFALPWERVDVVLGLAPNPTSESPLRDLDQLYLEVLSRYPDRKRLLDILGMVIVQTEEAFQGTPLSLEAINDLLDLRPGEAQFILRGMHAVLDIPTVDHPYNKIKIHHASFTDFLGDELRSGDYYIDRKYYRLLVISRSFSYLNKQLSIHQRSPETVFREDRLLRKIVDEWENWCEGIEEPTDEFLRTLGTFDWAASLDANVRYMLTRHTLESWSSKDKDAITPVHILLGIETIIKWLEKFPAAERVQNVINRLKQFSFHGGLHISLPPPLSQAISTWDTIAKCLGLNDLAFGSPNWTGDKEFWESLQECTSSVLDSFKIVDWRDCQCPHQDQRTPAAITECSYGVYYVPIRMFTGQMEESEGMGIDLKDRFSTYFPDAYKKYCLKARTASTSSILTDPPPYSASPPEFAPSISTSTKDDDGEMSLQCSRARSVNQILNANSDSNSEATAAISGSQCQPDSEPAFTEQHIFSDIAAQQLKSRAGLLDICQELSAPPLLDVGDVGPSHSGSFPLSDSLQSPSHNSEEGHEERSHSEPYCLVEQPTVLSPPSCAIERKPGPFDRSHAPGSCPEPVSEVSDPPNFGYFLGITTPQNGEIVKTLIEQGADVNAPSLHPRYSAGNLDQSDPISSTRGPTPLHFAAANEHKNIITTLPFRAADPDCEDKSGIMPAMLSKQRGWLECAEILNKWVAGDRDSGDGPETLGREGSLAEEDLLIDSGWAQKIDLILETSSSVHTNNTGSSQRPPTTSAQDLEQQLSQEVEEEIALLDREHQIPPFKALSGASSSSPAPGGVSLVLPNSSGELGACDDTVLASNLPQTSPEETGKSSKLRRIARHLDRYENKHRKKRTPEETQMLVDGCNKDGIGDWRRRSVLPWKAVVRSPDGRSPVDLKNRFRTYSHKNHYLKALSAPPLFILDVGEAGPSHAGSLSTPPQLLSDSLQTPSHSEEGHEKRSHSEPDCLVEQPIVLPPPSCAIERKLGSFDQSCAPGSCPEPAGEVPDPPKFKHILGNTTPRIPTRHFSSDWILSVHRDWGWLPNIGGERVPAPDKHNISRFISRLLAEWASSSPSAFNNANRFGMRESSIVNAQYFFQTINYPGPTGDSGQSVRDLQQQIEQLQKRVKQLEDERMLSRRNEDGTEPVLSESSDIRQCPETRLPPGPEPPPDKQPEQRNESTDENNYMQLPEGFQLHPSGFPSDGGSKDELLSRMEKQSDMLMEIIKANQRKEEETLSRIEQLLTTKLEPPLDSMVTIENYQMHTGTNPPLDHDDPNSTPTAEDRIRQLERQVEEQKLIIQQKDLENKNLRSSNHETLQRIEERLPPEPEPLPDRRYYDNSSSSNHQAYPSSHRQERFDNHPISLSRSHPQFEHHRPSGPSCISPDTSISHHHHPTNAGHPGPQRHLLARETDYGNQLRNGRTNHRPSSRTRRFRPYHGHDDPRTDSYSSPRHHSRERHSHRHFSR